MTVLRNIFGFLLAFLSVFVSIDLFLRFSYATPPLLKTFHPEFGAVNRPSIDYLKSVEGFFLGTTNYDGRFRESYGKSRAAPGVLRVLLVGDSFVEGIDVFSRHHFAALMEKQLSADLGRPVEILNFGRGNNTLSTSSFYFVNYIGKEYDYDLVLYFLEGRDIFADSQAYPSTAYVLDERTGFLVADYQWRQSGSYVVYDCLSTLLGTKRFEDLAVVRLGHRAMAPISTYGVVDTVLGRFRYQDYATTEVTAAVSAGSQKILALLKETVGPKLLFVLREHPIRVPAMKLYLTEQQLPFVELSEVLDGPVVRGTSLNVYKFKATGSVGGHWNHAGHRAVAAFLSKKVKAIYQAR